MQCHAVSQFTKRLESYGGVATDDIRHATTLPSDECECKLVADDQTQCCANYSDVRNSFEWPPQAAALTELSQEQDVPDVSNSVSSSIPQGN